jgi:hypothetical protein
LEDAFSFSLNVKQESPEPLASGLFSCGFCVVFLDESDQVFYFERVAHHPF